MEPILSFLKTYDDYVIPACMFLFVVLVGVTSFYFSTKNRILREFKKSRKKNVNSIKRNEYAKIIGQAKHVNTPLIAPLSGRECVYYHVIVEVQGDKNWRKIIDDVKTQDFFIDCASEMVMIKPETLDKNLKRIYLVKDFNGKSGFRKDLPKNIEAYLAQHNKKSTSFLGTNKQMRYKEGIIALNETIAVKGVAEWKTLNQPIEGYSYSKILTLTGTKKQKLLITDEPKALARVNIL